MLSVIFLHVYIILHKVLNLQLLGGTIPPLAQHVTHPLPCQFFCWLRCPILSLPEFITFPLSLQFFFSLRCPILSLAKPVTLSFYLQFFRCFWSTISSLAQFVSFLLPFRFLFCFINLWSTTLASYSFNACPLSCFMCPSLWIHLHAFWPSIATVETKTIIWD